MEELTNNEVNTVNKDLLKLIQPDPTEEQVRELCRAKKDELGFDIEKAIFPLNPLTDIDEPLISIEGAVLLAEQWAGVWGSVGASVGASVRESVPDNVGVIVGASVLGSVGSSVRDSVPDNVLGSVWASVWAYMSSIFYGIEDWKYIDHESGINPFKPAIDLWEAGYMCSFDGENYRLHAGPDAKIVWQGNF